MLTVDPSDWLRAVASIILAADASELRDLWNLTESFHQAREHSGGIPPGSDPLFAVTAADGLVDVARVDKKPALLDAALVAVAHALAAGAHQSRVRSVGMRLLLSPPLAKAETFALLCAKTGTVPAGRPGCEGPDPG